MFENLLDSVAQQNAFRHIHPGTKLTLCLGSLLICLISPSPVVPLISGIMLSLVLIIPSKDSSGPLWGTPAGPGNFFGYQCCGSPVHDRGGAVIWQFNPVPWINLTISEGAVREGTLVLCRVFGCSVSLFFIALTTPMTDLFNGMKRAKIPIELIDLMMIIYRYLFIVYAQAVEIWQAQVMRLGYSRPIEAIRSFSTLCGMLFISSWNAGEDLIHAMDCRCYDGIMPSLDQTEPIRIKSLLPVIIYLAFLGGVLLVITTGRVMPS